MLEYCKCYIHSRELCSLLTPRRSEKYVVPLSRNAYDLLLQWLSGASLDDEWEAGLHSAPGRQKEAIKLIVVSHLNITGKSIPFSY